MMQSAGTSFRRKRPTSDRDAALPFPAASLSTILVGVVLLSTLAAMIVGVHRGQEAVHLQIIPSEPSGAKAVTIDATIGGAHKGDGPTIRSLADLTPAELHPQAGPDRHIVTPPADDLSVSLVTCKTTVGYLHILVHPSWAPLGATRFLQMVNEQYFSTKVALMRCIKGFLCQFGIAGDPTRNKPYGGKNNLQDDPNWLPEGPTHRHNELGVKRFGKGYFAYAGSGKNSRSNQLIVALKDNEGLGGGSPWEVPWGEAVGKESFETLDKIYTGYGDKGPSQGRLHREGSSKAIAEDFPELDYVLGCEVIDSR
ncbi:hypothetical protein ACHAXT_004706 [Thalassiosira profunda]